MNVAYQCFINGEWHAGHFSKKGTLSFSTFQDCSLAWLILRSLFLDPGHWLVSSSGLPWAYLRSCMGEVGSELSWDILARGASLTSQALSSQAPSWHGSFKSASQEGESSSFHSHVANLPHFISESKSQTEHLQGLGKQTLCLDGWNSEVTVQKLMHTTIEDLLTWQKHLYDVGWVQRAEKQRKPSPGSWSCKDRTLEKLSGWVDKLLQIQPKPSEGVIESII